MSDALAKVKCDMGRNAVILHTRTIRRGGLFGIGARSLVEITATNDARVMDARAAAKALDDSSAVRGARVVKPAIMEYMAVLSAPASNAPCPEKATAVQAAPTEQPGTSAAAPVVPDPVMRHDVEEIRLMVADLLRRTQQSQHPRVPGELVDYYVRLIGQDVGDELATQLLERLAGRLRENGPVLAKLEGGAQASTVAGASAPPEWIREELQKLVSETLPPAEPLRLTATGRPTIVALVGPTGVGKTTTIAKLAANMKLRKGKTVGLITIDTYRIAAVEQLKVYAQILDVPLAAVVSQAEMAAAIGRMSDLDLILIDTAGRSQRDEPRIAELQGLLSAAQPDQVHLVLATTSREATIHEAIKNFSVLGIQHLIFTKLDEALGFGVILNVLNSVNMRLSYLTTGQSVPNDIEEGSAWRIAQLIVGQVSEPARASEEVSQAPLQPPEGQLPSRSGRAFCAGVLPAAGAEERLPRPLPLPLPHGRGLVSARESVCERAVGRQPEAAMVREGPTA
ncbi:MAG TPA: flagellar biosynthesis protein FlhF [Phycisphaerae bacterium]|nr:flagellar biosynthesis protein FlhF [Phycisphaerae bacterium]